MPVVDGERGRAFDLRDRPIDVGDVAAAIAADGSGSDDCEDAIDVRCAAPGPVHQRVGVIEAERSYPLQAALTAAARQLGHESAVVDELATVRKRLASLELPAVSLENERRQVAETDDATALQEEVATLRGQLEAACDRGDDSEALADARERAVADLTERRTERLAAEQSLDRAQASAREARDHREKRLRLEDREGNLEREAREDLAATIQPSFERALTALPCCGSPSELLGDSPWTVDGPDAVGALAVCRLAPIAAPVILAGDWFTSATAARAALDAPVILVEA